MAHKVLSKDMASLVEAMQQAQKYSRTTLDNEYRKGMLAAAHILAMDAKNLLDVVDSVRIRTKELKYESQSAGMSLASPCANVASSNHLRPLSFVASPSSALSTTSQSSGHGTQSRQPSSFMSFDSNPDSRLSVSSKVLIDDANDSGYDIT